MLIVSRFAGTYSISGVSISGQVMQLVLGIGTGLLAGFTIVIAQYYGKQESDERFKEIIGKIGLDGRLDGRPILCTAAAAFLQGTGGNIP